MMQFDFLPAGADPILAFILALCVVVLIMLLELYNLLQRTTALETDLARYMGIVANEPGLFLPADIPEGEVKK